MRMDTSRELRVLLAVAIAAMSTAAFASPVGRADTIECVAPGQEAAERAITDAHSADGVWVPANGLARTGHTAVYDPVGNRMVIFGGRTPCGVFGFEDVWALSMAGDPTWSPLAPAGIPPDARSGHTAVYDSRRGRVLIFGGESDGNLVADAWALTLNPEPKWTKLFPTGPAPSPRFGHTAIYDPLRDRMLVFGGSQSTTTSGGFMTDMWELTLEGVPTWREILPGGVSPLAAPSLAAYDPETDRMVVVVKPIGCGGWGGPPCPGDIAWSLALDGPPVWEPVVTTGDPPDIDPRTGVYDSVRNRIVILGTWTLTLGDNPTWNRISVTGTWPPQVGGPVVFDPVGDRLVMFGGVDVAFYYYGSCNDASVYDTTWALSLGGVPAWTELTTLTDPVPDLLSGHAAVYDPPHERMIVFGGLGPHNPSLPAGSPLDDTWMLRLNGGAARWLRLVPSGARPSARWGHTAIFDPLRERMIVFGGDDGVPREDTWALSTRGEPVWTELFPTGEPPQAGTGYMSVYDPVGDRMIVTDGFDTWSLSLGGAPAWSEVVPSGPRPPARRQGSLIYDPARRRLVLFGGGLWSDTWALTLGPDPTWTSLSPSGTGPAGRQGQATVYDPVRDRMVIFGGASVFDDCTGFCCPFFFTYSDAWALDLVGDTAWTKLLPDGPACGLDGGGVSDVPLQLPAAYDPRGDRMIVTRGKITSALAWGHPPLPITVDIDPDVINLSGRGRWLSAYVKASGFELTDIVLSTVRLGGSVAAEEGFAAIDDRDGDGIPDMMLKFPRAAMDPLLHPGANWLEVTGSLRTGESFSGSDRVRVIQGRRH